MRAAVWSGFKKGFLGGLSDIGYTAPAAIPVLAMSWALELHVNVKAVLIVIYGAMTVLRLHDDRREDGLR